MNGVIWRDAVAGDRSALEQFTCTTRSERGPDGRRLPHPRPWELEAQVGIRKRKPPGPRGDIYRVGTGINGSIVAVSAAGAVVDPGLEPTFKLLVLAVSTSQRGGGGQVADLGMLDALTCMQRQADVARAAQFLVVGFVDPRNHASQRLCRRHGFSVIDQDDQYEVWVDLCSPVHQRPVDDNLHCLDRVICGQDEDMTDDYRIGNADREAALAALQQHLSAGRIELDEFDERSATIAQARTRADLEPVFADLPEPHAIGAPVNLAKERPDWRQVRVNSTGPMGGPLLGRFGEVAVGLSPFIALALFLIFGVWWVWLLIPVAGVVVYGNRHDHGRDRRRDHG